MRFTAYLTVILGLLIHFLISAKGILIPIVLSLVLWYLINATELLIEKLPVIGRAIHFKIRIAMAALIVLITGFSISSILSQNINGILQNSESYVINLQAQSDRLLSSLGINNKISISSSIRKLDLNAWLSQFIGSLTRMAQQLSLILLYTLFLLVEQNTIPKKIKALKISDENRVRLNSILTDVNLALKKYIGVKFAASLGTAFLSFIVLSWTNLPFAFFWAFFVFVLNFVPTIGSIIATIIPALVALVEFDHLRVFYTILIGIGTVQIIIGSIIEPRLYGFSLNISPFIILLSLVIWGNIWGIAGMLLCIPITVAMIIVFSRFKSTRPIAIVLTQNGKLITS